MLLRSLLISAFGAFTIASIAQTIGLTRYDEAYADGYMLFSPIPSTRTYLIDRCGREVNSWTGSQTPGQSAQLQADGTLLRSANAGNPLFDAGGRGGRLERFNWNGDLLWSYELSNDNLCQHHDFTVLPNGNILAIAWDRHDSAEAVARGKHPANTNAELWGDRLIELQPFGTNGANVVWEWRIWDHMVQDFDNVLPAFGVVADHPELMDINFFPGPPASFDWIHLNSVVYNAELDQVLVSAHTPDEIWVIDHSTTTAQAAGHSGGTCGRGGDLLYRWGNPRSYDRGVFADKRFYGQHHATWLPPGHPDAGKIMVFNNGNGRPGGNYTSVDIIDPPLLPDGNYAINAGEAFGPASVDTVYAAPTPSDFYCSNIGGVFPVADGYLLTDGAAGRTFQIDANDSIRWEYICPVNTMGPMTQGDAAIGNLVFRSEFYPPDFPGFAGQSLVPGDEIELEPLTPALCASTGLSEVGSGATLTLHPNPFTDQLVIEGALARNAKVRLWSMTGQAMDLTSAGDGPRLTIDTSMLGAGAYILEAVDGSGVIITRQVAVKSW